MQKVYDINDQEIELLDNETSEWNGGSNGVYYKKVNNRIDVKLVNTEIDRANAVVYVYYLPEGYRPTDEHYFTGSINALATSNVAGYIGINGAIRVISNITGTCMASTSFYL